MFNTVSKKKIAIFGFAFKKDTGDTRETPAIDVCKGLIRDGGKVCVYDPEVSPDQIFRDMSTPKFEWDKPNYTKSASHFLENVQVCLMRIVDANELINEVFDYYCSFALEIKICMQ